MVSKRWRSRNPAPPRRKLKNHSCSTCTSYARRRNLERANKVESDKRDYSGTPAVAVYVKLPSEIINMECELVDPNGDLLNQLRTLKSVNVYGVKVDIWWGLVEANYPQQYNWKGYKQLFQIVREAKLKLQVVMSFHECKGYIPLPKWIKEIGEENPDIYFTDRDGRRNPETLTWGIDEEPVLRGRTAVKVYIDCMNDFRVEFDEFLKDRSIIAIEVGLGACGELCYPSSPSKHGWEYPGIGEFQCYDKYLRKSLQKAAEARGESSWGTPPDNAGSYNSQPDDTMFFCDDGDKDSAYGKFFLNWYSQYLLDHGDRLLTEANNVFRKPGLVFVKLSGMRWLDNAASRAAELTAGFGDSYAPIISMLEMHHAGFNFTCVGPEAMVDPEGFVLRVLNDAWNVCLQLVSENALPCYDRRGYNKLLEIAKPIKAPCGRHLSAFTYVMLNRDLLEQQNIKEFEVFVKSMRGESCA